MRNFTLVVVLAGGLLSGFSSESFGQLSVQQPILQSTGGNFAVSVPDRGGVFLGGISRAGESRKSYGFPFTRGSSVGRFSQHSSLSSHVWIHDLREMDRQILEMAESDPLGQRAETSETARRAGLAWTTYQPRRGVSVDDRRPVSSQFSQRYRSSVVAEAFPERFRSSRSEAVRQESVESATAPSPAPRSRALDPAHSYRLGVEAEESGKVSLAKLHYQAAAQYGSAEGARRLRELAAQPVVSK